MILMMLGRQRPTFKHRPADAHDAGPLGVLTEQIIQLMLMMLGRRES